MREKALSVRMMSCDAVLIAMYVVLNFFSIKLGGNFKFTLDAFPIIVGAVLFGPLHGSLIGFLGSSIYQLFFSGYGITPTTLLWILPAVVRGFIIGLYSKHRAFDPPRFGLIIITIISGLAVTSLNTLALYVDSLIFNYYSYELVFGILIPKYIISAILAIVFSLIIPALIRLIKKNIKL